MYIFAEFKRLGEESTRLFEVQLIGSRDAHTTLEFLKFMDYRAQCVCVCMCVCTCVCACVCVCTRAFARTIQLAFEKCFFLAESTRLSEESTRLFETQLADGEHARAALTTQLADSEHARAALERQQEFVVTELKQTLTKHEEASTESKVANTATHCNTLQHTATHCNTLQHTALCCNILQHTVQHTATLCDTLQHIATLCNTLQHTATHSLNMRGPLRSQS